MLKDHDAISTYTRSQLIDDSLNIARTGSLPYSVAFELSRYLRSERDYTPWISALKGFDYLDRMLYHTSSKDKLRVLFYYSNITTLLAYNLLNLQKEYIKWLLLPTYEHIGFNEKKGDSSLVISNRNQMISWACRLDVAECVNNTTALYKSWMTQPDNHKYETVYLEVYR